jgi:hypothetical protein
MAVNTAKWQIEKGRKASRSIACWDEALGDRITVFAGRPDFARPPISML